MKHVRWAAVGLALACGGAGPLTEKSSVDDVLDAMRDRGRDLKSFTADVTQTRVDAMGSAVTYHGHVWFEALAGGDARLHFQLDTKQKGKLPPVRYRQEYLLDKGWLTNRDYAAKNEDVRQVVQPGQKLDLFQLGKGPFPLPIGQDKAKVEALFDVAERPADAGDPPHAVHLRLTPKPGTEFARDYDTIDFWVDPARRMPVRIEMVGKDGGSDQTNDLANVRVNPPVADADFTLTPLDNAVPPNGRSWTTASHPFGH